MISYDEAMNAMICCNELGIDCCEKCACKDSASCDEDIEKTVIKHYRKYKWINLQVNPHKLPQNGERVDIAYNTADGEEIRMYAYAYKYNDTVVFHADNGKLLMTSDIKAWRKVEPFKEEKL